MTTHQTSTHMQTVSRMFLRKDGSQNRSHYFLVYKQWRTLQAAITKCTTFLMALTWMTRMTTSSLLCSHLTTSLSLRVLWHRLRWRPGSLASARKWFPTPAWWLHHRRLSCTTATSTSSQCSSSRNSMRQRGRRWLQVRLPWLQQNVPVPRASNMEQIINSLGVSSTNKIHSRCFQRLVAQICHSRVLLSLRRAEMPRLHRARNLATTIYQLQTSTKEEAEPKNLRTLKRAQVKTLAKCLTLMASRWRRWKQKTSII